MKNLKQICVLSLALLTVSAFAGEKVFFISPKNHAKIKNPVKIKFGVEGMQIKPAGEMLKMTGHHHLILDGGSIAKGQPVPMDAKHMHFGKGQTETELQLPPGKHTLTLQFADGAHLSYGESMSTSIDITVE